MDSKKSRSAKGRQSSSGRLPSRHVKNPYRQYVFLYSIPFLHLKISLHNFLTTDLPSRKGLLFRFNLFKYRELAIERVKPEPAAQLELPDFKLPKLSLQPTAAVIASVLIIAGLGGAAYSLIHLHKQVDIGITPASAATALSAPAPTPAPKVMPKSTPTELIIPKINLDTRLAETGLDSSGAIAMPFDIYTASWYQYSPTPGELGPSIIVGHLDGADYADLTGIFWRLHELNPGDQISIDRADGSVANFKVMTVKQVPRANFPTQEIYGNINYAGLRIITCGGTFHPDLNQYDHNTVVFAALE